MKYAMRYKLKTMLIILALVCILLARSQHLRFRYSDLTSNGAKIYYEWQNPVIVETQGFHWRKPTEYVTLPATTDGLSAPYPQAFYRNYRVTVSNSEQSLMSKLAGAVIGSKPKIVELSDANLNAEQLAELKSMDSLESILHIKSAASLSNNDVRTPAGQKITGDFGRGKIKVLLTKELPGVEIYYQTRFW